jgi:hypothetical protein
MPGDSEAVIDLVYIALIVAFFAASVGLARLCAGLRGGAPRP